MGDDMDIQQGALGQFAQAGGDQQMDADTQQRVLGMGQGPLSAGAANDFLRQGILGLSVKGASLPAPKTGIDAFRNAAIADDPDLGPAWRQYMQQEQETRAQMAAARQRTMEERQQALSSLGQPNPRGKDIALLQLAAGLLSPGSFSQGLSRGVAGMSNTLQEQQKQEEGIARARAQLQGNWAGQDEQQLRADNQSALSGMKTLASIRAAQQALMGKQIGGPSPAYRQAASDVQASGVRPDDPAFSAKVNDRLKLIEFTGSLTGPNKEMASIMLQANPNLTAPEIAAELKKTVDNSTHTGIKEMPDGTGWYGQNKRTGVIERVPHEAGLEPQISITPVALESAAARYNVDGSFPPGLGRGIQGSINQLKVLNRAAELAGENGNTPLEQRIQQIAGKASTTALADLAKRQTNVGAFEKNFVKNTTLVEELSKKIDRTGVPFVNSWIMKGKRAIEGDPDVSQYDTVIKDVVNEYAKIVSGSMGNAATAEGEIKKIESLLNDAQTPEQVSKVIEIMKKQTANRMAGFDEQRAELMNSFTPRAKTAAPGAAAPASLEKQAQDAIAAGADAAKVRARYKEKTGKDLP